MTESRYLWHVGVDRAVQQYSGEDCCYGESDSGRHSRAANPETAPTKDHQDNSRHVGCCNEVRNTTLESEECTQTGERSWITTKNMISTSGKMRCAMCKENISYCN